MQLRIKQDCAGVDWESVTSTLRCVGMAYFDAATHRKAFEGSYSTIFVYHADQLIGFGRAISDGVYQAAVYDCAVLPEFQGQGIGRLIMEEILSQIPQCNVVLYASPGKEAFYEKHGFRKMKTGMARFIKADKMSENGFTK